MSCPRHTLLALLATGALLLPAGLSCAQDAVNRPASPPDVSKLAPRLIKSRIAFFRQLLVMTDTERHKRLAAYGPARQAGIEAKIAEYLALSPEQRELRLLVTELQDYLLPLMGSPATNRAEQISMLPTNVAPMVEVRLRQWDGLSPEQQKEVLENKPLLDRLTRFASISPIQQNQVLTNMTPDQRKALQEGVARWQSLPEPQRQAITSRFQQYFELTPAEKERTLHTLSEAERAEIQKTVRAYVGLDPQSRARVNTGLEKFCRLSPSEIGEFLRSAERWQRLTPGERKAWRDLVSRASLLPPLPPGAQLPSRFPPAPPNPGSTERIATNH